MCGHRRNESVSRFSVCNLEFWDFTLSCHKRAATPGRKWKSYWLGNYEISGLGISRNYETVSGNSLSTSEIIARYGVDELASKLVNEAVSEFALALNHATMILDPVRIIIGGGFWLGSDLFRKLTRARFDELMADNLKPEIVDAHLKSGALIGAGELAYRLGNSKRS
jgi:predicted NBD/HSP70 family sugar kinase